MKNRRTRVFACLVTLCLVIPLLGATFRGEAPSEIQAVTDKTVLTAAQLPAAISEAEAAERGYVARLSDAEPNLLVM